MLLEQIDSLRFFSIIFGQGTLGVFFLIISSLLFKRNKLPFGKIVSGFYLLEAIAFFINIVYFFIRINPITSILFFLTLYLVSFAPVFLVLFCLTLYNSEEVIQRHSTWIFVILYGFILSVILLIPGSYEISERTNWKPESSLFLFISLYILISFFIIGPAVILMIKISSRFENQALKKRWTSFQLGFYIIASGYYLTILYTFWNNSVFHSIFLISTILLIPAGYYIYRGIGKEL